MTLLLPVTAGCQLSQRGSKGPRVNQKSRSPVAHTEPGSVFVRTMGIFDNVQSLQVSMASDNVVTIDQ